MALEFDMNSPEIRIRVDESSHVGVRGNKITAVAMCYQELKSAAIPIHPTRVGKNLLGTGVTDCPVHFSARREGMKT